MLSLLARVLLLERSQLSMHQSHKHTSLKQWASLAEACLVAPCNINGRKEVRGDKKVKIRVFLFPAETGSGPGGRKTSRYFHKVATERRSVPLPCWVQDQPVPRQGCIALMFPQPSRAWDEGTDFLAAGSCHS